MARFVATLDELLSRPPRHLLLLFSGGLDSSYLLHRLTAGTGRPVPVTALNVRIGPQPDSGRAAELAARFDASYREVDATGEFFAEFVPAAVHADAYYQGQFPVGSTLTRPLMARVAVAAARELGCDAVGHTATYMQNSAARLSRSVAALDPGLDLVVPFLGSNLSREAKLAGLRAAGVELASGVHSVDANPWSRVIENGSLESPENRLAEQVFEWTRPAPDCPVEPAELELEFRAGLPVTLDGRRQPLSELVASLNTRAGEHGVGRFSGLEDTPFGVKNHEVRESPAAAVITTAHRALANAVFPTADHAVRAGIATEWTNLVVHGGWFGHLARCLAGCLAELDAPVTGSVQLRLHYATVTVLRLESGNGLYYTRLGGQFHDLMQGYSYPAWHRLATLADRADPANLEL